jgi:hypothetical protein
VGADLVETREPDAALAAHVVEQFERRLEPREPAGQGRCHTEIHNPPNSQAASNSERNTSIAFLASFDELLISLFLAGVRAQTLPVRIWNSLNLQIEPTIAAVSAFLIGVTTLILAADGVLRHRRGRRR